MSPADPLDFNQLLGAVDFSRDLERARVEHQGQLERIWKGLIDTVDALDRLGAPAAAVRDQLVELMQQLPARGEREAAVHLTMFGPGD